MSNTTALRERSPVVRWSFWRICYDLQNSCRSIRLPPTFVETWKDQTFSCGGNTTQLQKPRPTTNLYDLHSTLGFAHPTQRIDKNLLSLQIIVDSLRDRSSFLSLAFWLHGELLNQKDAATWERPSKSSTCTGLAPPALTVLILPSIPIVQYDK